MASYAYSSGHEDVAQINITPLVDVMLVLLVIFMIAAPVVAQPIPMDLPGSGPGRTPPAEPIRVRVDAAGQLYWNDSPTPLAALQALLQAEVQRDPARKPLLQVEASGDADYGIVAKVLAAARNAEVDRIAFR